MSKKLDATGIGLMNAMKRIKKVQHLPYTTTIHYHTHPRFEEIFTHTQLLATHSARDFSYPSWLSLRLSRSISSESQQQQQQTTTSLLPHKNNKNKNKREKKS
jgi:hypothetical protein